MSIVDKLGNSRQEVKHFFLDATYASLFSAVAFGPIEVYTLGLEQAVWVRAGMTINSFLGMGRGFGIARESWLTSQGVGTDSGKTKKIFHEILVNEAYFVSIYALTQYGQGVSPQEISQTTLFALGMGLFISRPYGYFRDKFFELCNESGTLTSGRISNAGKFLALPVQEAYRVARSRTTLDDAFTATYG